MKKCAKFLDCINLSKYINNHLVGKDHTIRHQKIAGIAIMLTGVAIGKLSLLIDAHLIHYIGDVVGYGIHGIGLIPFVKDFEK